MQNTNSEDSIVVDTGQSVRPPGVPANLHGDSGVDPPTYDEAIHATNIPPPSYESLFGRVKEAHKTSKGIFDFLKNVVVLILGTIGCSIILGATIVIPMCMIVIGSFYMYQCPQGEYIPVYLLVGGLLGVLKQLLHLSVRVRKTSEEMNAERLRHTPAHTMLDCFMLGWFIIGSVWVYELYEPNYDPTLGSYCHKTVYLFAYWLITSAYICLAAITFCLCTLAMATLWFYREQMTSPLVDRRRTKSNNSIFHLLVCGSAYGRDSIKRYFFFKCPSATEIGDHHGDEIRDEFTTGICLTGERKQMNLKVFNDSIHGHMAFHPLLVAIIDTPQFQRLRNIKQLGLAYFVYPSACHNRFEHCLGTCHLAGKLMEALNKNREVEESERKKEMLCVQIAGLCHDLGHGPFSHTWEKFLERCKVEWKHEDCSVEIFGKVLNEQVTDPDTGVPRTIRYLFEKSGLGDEEIQIIKDIIKGIVPKKEELFNIYFLYQMISNSDNDIDVDKWDYLLRDKAMLNLPVSFDHRRLLEYCQVMEVEEDINGGDTTPRKKKSQICYRKKECANIIDMFLTRATLHDKAYQHKIVKIIEEMVIDAFFLAKDKFDLASPSTDNILKLTDHIYQRILYEDHDQTLEGKKILQRIEKRDLYICLLTKKLKKLEEIKEAQQILLTKEQEVKINSWLANSEIDSTFENLITELWRPQKENSAKTREMDCKMKKWLTGLTEKDMLDKIDQTWLDRLKETLLNIFNQLKPDPDLDAREFGIVKIDIDSGKSNRNGSPLRNVYVFDKVKWTPDSSSDLHAEAKKPTRFDYHKFLHAIRHDFQKFERRDILIIYKGEKRLEITKEENLSRLDGIVDNLLTAWEKECLRSYFASLDEEIVRNSTIRMLLLKEQNRIV